MKYWKNLTDKEKIQIYNEICNSELYQETLQEKGNGWCTEFSERFMMYKNVETEKGDIISVERFKEILFNILKNLKGEVNE